MTPAEMRRRADELDAEALQLEVEASEMVPQWCACPRRCPPSCRARVKHQDAVLAYQLRAETLRDESGELRAAADQLAAPVPLRAHVRRLVAGWCSARASEWRERAAQQRRWAAEDEWGREGRLWSASEMERLAEADERAARDWMAA